MSITQDQKPKIALWLSELSVYWQYPKTTHTPICFLTTVIEIEMLLIKHSQTTLSWACFTNTGSWTKSAQRSKQSHGWGEHIILAHQFIFTQRFFSSSCEITSACDRWRKYNLKIKLFKWRKCFYIVILNNFLKKKTHYISNAFGLSEEKLNQAVHLPCSSFFKCCI